MENCVADNIKPVYDLRDWLERANAIGELQKINAEVDPIEEMSAITYLLAKSDLSPAVLFDSDQNDMGIRHLWNIFGPSVQRTASTLEEAPTTSTLELIKRTKDKLRNRIAPKEVSATEALIFQNTLLGDDIN
ncbi:UbiD family decarboxylase, partial [Acinetobacter baumannii]|nr:UbiD family decarboxylase [Acinetobacter baumannii]